MTASDSVGSRERPERGRGDAGGRPPARARGPRRRSRLPWIVGLAAVLAAGAGALYGSRIWKGTPSASVLPVPAADDGAATWYGRAAGEPNKLAGASTPYLRNAADQPVNWYEWGEEAFGRARELDRPILLDVGAFWCTACDYMDGDSYADAEIASQINSHFVAIRVDRDARPDIDARYQSMAREIAGTTGWPLTLFLTPDGKAYAGGTFFLADGDNETQGLRQVLPTAYTAYYRQRGEILAYADQLQAKVLASQAEFATAGGLMSSVSDAVAAELVASFDRANAGWGRTAKFTAGPSVAFALARHEREIGAEWLTLATRTLDAMASGSLRDHVSGGFFRSTADQRYKSPHFEKLCFANAETLSNYVRAFELTGNANYKKVAGEIVGFVQTLASDQRQGGFYASLSAGNGTYYTWTRAEAEEVLTPEQAEVLLPHLGIADEPTNPQEGREDRNVLAIAKPAEAIASELGRPLPDVEGLIETGKQALAARRASQGKVPVDTTIYAHWNALMISAYFDAARVLDRPVLRSFAVKTMDFLLANMYTPEQGVMHGWSDGAAFAPGLLDDQMAVANALIDTYEATNERRYLDAAVDVVASAIGALWDEEAGGFRVIDERLDPAGILSPFAKPVLDNPTAAGNGMAPVVLDRLAEVTADTAYRERAEECLIAFSGGERFFGAMAAAYAEALDGHIAKYGEKTGGPAEGAMAGATAAAAATRASAASPAASPTP